MTATGVRKKTMPQNRDNNAASDIAQNATRSRTHLSTRAWVKICLVILLGIVVVGGGSVAFTSWVWPHGLEIGLLSGGGNDLGDHDWQIGSGNISAAQSQQLKNIKCDWSVNDITITTYDSNNITINESDNGSVTEDEQVHWALDGNTLYILSNTPSWRCGAWFDDDEQVTVNLPKTLAAAMGTVKLEDSVGNVALSGITCDDLTATCSTGGVSLDNVNANTADVSTSTGSLQANGFTVASLKASVSTGNVSLAGAFTNIESHVSTGELDISSSAIPATIDSSVSSGSSDIKIPEGQDNGGFTAKSHVSSGSFTCGFAAVSNGGDNPTYVYKDGQSQYSFTVSTGSSTLEPVS
jgi:hypothetical protein